jgi:hypothetical protein
MIPKSIPSGFDRMGGNRLSENIVLRRNIQPMIRLDHGLVWRRSHRHNRAVVIRP